MNIIIGDNNASCEISGSWESPASRNPKYARVKVSQVSKKRPRAQNPLERGCAVNVSLWSASRTATSRSIAKSLRKSYESEVLIPGRQVSAKILAVNSIIEEPSYELFTWVAVAVSKNKNKYGVALARVGENSVSVAGVIPVREPPLQVAILRGPRIIVRTSSDVTLLNVRDGKNTMQTYDAQKAGSRLICQTERDTEALILVAVKEKGSSFRISLQLASWRGSASALWEVNEWLEYMPTAMAASLRLGVVALAGAKDGSMLGIDVRTGAKLWQTQPKQDLGDILCMCFYRRMLLLTGKRTEDLFYISNVQDQNTSSHRLVLKRLFAEKCEAVGSSNHGHLFMRWRDCVLQMNDITGTCCKDETFPTEAKTLTSKITESPSLPHVRRNLERRVNMGAAALIVRAERIQDKHLMIEHVAGMLQDLTGKVPGTLARNPFDGRLETLCLQERRRARFSTIPLQEEDLRAMKEVSGSTRVAVDGQRKPLDIGHFVRLISSTSKIDPSGQFVVLLVEATVICPIPMEDNSKRPLCLHLVVQTDEGVPAMWQVNVKREVTDGETILLSASSPITNVTAESSPVHQTARVSVVADGRHSQHIGVFAMSGMLSSVCTHELSSRKGATLSLPFQHRLHVTAEGRSAHHLDSRLFSQDRKECTHIKTRENLACLTHIASSGPDLAMEVARLKSNLDDDASLRSSLKPARSSLRGLDSALLGLDCEISQMHEAGARRDAFGYSSAEARMMLQRQLFVDEAFGCTEEMLLGL